MSDQNPPNSKISKKSKKKTPHSVAKARTHVANVTSTRHTAIARGQSGGTAMRMMSAPDADAAAGGPDPWEPK